MLVRPLSLPSPAFLPPAFRSPGSICYNQQLLTTFDSQVSHITWGKMSPCAAAVSSEEGMSETVETGCGSRESLLLPAHLHNLILTRSPCTWSTPAPSRTTSTRAAAHPRSTSSSRPKRTIRRTSSARSSRSSRLSPASPSSS